MRIDQLVRPEIRNLKPYTSARDEVIGTNYIFMDANENPYNASRSRYPDPQQRELRASIAGLKGVKPEQVFAGNGSDEAIDLLIRIFCSPGISNILAPEPTYGMYRVQAAINGTEYRQVNLNPDFSLNPDAILSACDKNTRLIFLCSPNNPTANLLGKEAIRKILVNFKGIVVVDEAYLDFSGDSGWVPFIGQYPNLVVLQTFSKAWGLASLRLGYAIGNTEIIRYMMNIKYPYNVNQPTRNSVIQAINCKAKADKWVRVILEERKWLEFQLNNLSCIQKVYPSDANFILAKFRNAASVYEYLKSNGIVVRQRKNEPATQDCLRISIGKKSDNRNLLKLLKDYK